MDLSDRSIGLSHRGEASRRNSARSGRKTRTHLLPEKDDDDMPIPRASIRSTGIQSLITMDSALDTAGDDEMTNFSVDEEETNLREVPNPVFTKSSGSSQRGGSSTSKLLRSSNKKQSQMMMMMVLAAMMFVGAAWVYNPSSTMTGSSLLKGREGADERDEPVMDWEGHEEEDEPERLLENPSSTATCPETICANLQANTLATASGNCNNLELVQLDVYTHTNGEEWVELWGPSDPADAAAVILVSGHGGSLRSSALPDRSGSGISTSKDSYTMEIAEWTADKLIDNYCKVPYFVKNNLHRSKMDANREIQEAALGNALAEDAWKAFHNFIQEAQVKISDQFGGPITNYAGKKGVPGLLVDFHGYTGYGWDSAGSPHIQWGYRYGSTSLNTLCPLDNHQYNETAGSLSFGAGLLGQSNECLVRGPLSLGDRLNSMLPISSYAPNEDVCGTGLPSMTLPDPVEAASDSNICTNSGSSSCSYYSGGYITKQHEEVNWDDGDSPIAAMNNVLMNTVQAEFPRCLRFATGPYGRSKVHPALADKLSQAICSFVHDLFPTKALCG